MRYVDGEREDASAEALDSVTASNLTKEGCTLQVFTPVSRMISCCPSTNKQKSISSENLYSLNLYPPGGWAQSMAGICHISGSEFSRISLSHSMLRHE